MPAAEIPLAGGMGSGGAVVRVGDTVRRPARPHSASVADFLRHLEAVGFDGAPRHLGHDAAGRVVLTFVEGDVGLPPFPRWTAGDGLLASVAALQRDLHAAAATYRPPPDAVWDRANLPAHLPADHARNARRGVLRSAIVCHNDLCVENVVVRGGRAVAFIDFDFAAPVDPLFDIAVAARHWVPVRDPADLDDGRRGIDAVARFHAFCAGHGLDAVGRAAVVAHLGGFLDRALGSMRSRAEAGLPGYVAVWAAGYPEQNRRSRAWLDAHAAELTG
jgi:hypothetical protein